MKTAVYNVRLDIRALATLYHYYASKGISLDSISTLTRKVIESQANGLIEKGAKPFVDTSEAINYFESLGLMKPLRNRGNPSIVKELQRESLIKDGLDEGYLDRKSLNNIDEDQIEAARRALKIIQESKNECSGAILGPVPGQIKP